VLRRLDTTDRREIPARLDRVALTDRRTAIRAGADRVDTVEHLLAAVAASETDDLDIEVDGPEIPILDGSFAPFSEALAAAGLRESAGVGPSPSGWSLRSRRGGRGALSRRTR
jgi:UDP-3-O-acyl-N-acetylglucosamine deacetylase